MITNRRNFIRATAAMSLIGASQARAASGDRWIGFVHSTALAPEWKQTFYAGLRSQGWEADPTRDVGSNTRLNILHYDIGGKYTGGAFNNGDISNIGSAVKDVVGTLPAATTSAGLKAIVTAGGIVAAKAAVTALTTIGSSTPLVSVIGNLQTGIGTYANAEGIYLDDASGGGSATNGNALRLNDLKTRYGLSSTAAQKQICLLYNGNSAMGATEKAYWTSTLVAGGLSVDASNSSHNEKMDIENAFVQALKMQAQAILVSADPFFGHRIQEIVRVASKPKYQSLVMCYPLQDYASMERKTGRNLHQDNFMARGPALASDFDNLGNVTDTNAVYYQLGVTVGKRIGSSPSSTFAFAPATSTYTGLPAP
jgi:hypothetical protein